MYNSSHVFDWFAVQECIVNVKAGEFSGKLSIMMALFLLETSAQHCSAEKMSWQKHEAAVIFNTFEVVLFM